MIIIKKHQGIKKAKKLKNIYIQNIFIIILKILFIILTIIFGYKLPPIDKLIEEIEIIFDNIILKSIDHNIRKKDIKPEPNFEYFCCFCSMGKEENLYVRELINYYLSLGVKKFVLGDNNLPNTEKLSDVLQDYIKNGIVDIIDIIGSTIGQGDFYGKIYQKYKNKCQWLMFFDFDEYLVIHNKYGKHISIQEYLTYNNFTHCDAILFNWLMYGDNGYIYYNKRPLMERFTTPDYFNYANKFVKSIVRGNLTGKVFGKGNTNHQPNEMLSLSNSLGEKPKYFSEAVIPPNFKNAFLMHFNTKTVEEYANKIKRGYPGNHSEPSIERIKLFFIHNEFTLKKLKMFEKKFNITFKKRFKKGYYYINFTDN